MHGQQLSPRSGPDWLQGLLQDAIAANVCTKLGCTTCGATVLREALEHSIDQVAAANGHDRVEEMVAQLRGVTMLNRSWEFDELVRFVIMVLYSGWYGNISLPELRVRLDGTDAGKVLQRMEAHHSRVAAERAEYARRNSPEAIEEARRLKRAEKARRHAARLAEKARRERRLPSPVASERPSGDAFGRFLTRRFDQALAYASAIHRTQRRKGSGVPYVAHLLGTASIALEAGADEDQAIAALLHDSAEDQGGEARLEDVRIRFGERVARIVADCTDAYTDPKPDWRPRKEAYIAGLEGKSPDSLLVSLCDKIYNAEAILADLLTEGDRLWDRFTGGKEGTLWYYRELAGAFERLLPGQLSHRLAGVVADIHRHAEAGWDEENRGG